MASERTLTTLLDSAVEQGSSMPKAVKQLVHAVVGGEPYDYYPLCA